MTRWTIMVLAALGIAVFSGCGANSTGMTSLTTYTSSLEQLTADFPQDWTVAVDSPDNTGTLCPLQGKSADGLAMVTIARSTTINTTDTLDTAAATVINAVTASTSAPLVPTHLTINGISAVQYNGQVSTNGVQYSKYYTFLLKNQKLYTIQASAVDSFLGQYDATLVAIANSVKLLN